MKLQSSNPPAETHADEQLKSLEMFQRCIQRADIGFFAHTADKSAATLSKTTARRFAHKKLLVHVGIGGSSLGPEMLLSALGVSAGKEVQFVNNIDADMLARQMKSWSVPDTFFYIVSKSGGTAETMAALSIILHWLSQHGVSEAQWKEYIVICTDPQKGDLRQFGRDHQLAALEVPSNIGGRFSVLSDVGLFPAAWAGVNVDQLLQGAEQAKAMLLNAQPEQNLLTLTTHWLETQHQLGRTLTVLMPYSSLLKDFTAWWVQLWAESLGKDGKGLTPVMAYGATDQHSQMQLFMQGPADKAMLMLGVEEAGLDFSLKNSSPLTSLKTLALFSLKQLMEAEYAGTLKALAEAKRPYLDLRIKRLNAESLGELILFFESLTALVGIRLGVDPFNQPGVEAGKKYAHDWLSHKAT
jgi:glucose-6-phosphate isomerase